MATNVAAIQAEMDELLKREHLGERASKERKALLISSMVTFALAGAKLVPTQIAVIGISISEIDEHKVLVLVGLIVMYFWVSFILHALPDFLAWRVDYLRLRHRVAMGAWEEYLKFGNDYDDAVPPGWEEPPEKVQALGRDLRKSSSRWMTWVFLKGSIVDMALPMLVGWAALVLILRRVVSSL